MFALQKPFVNATRSKLTVIPVFSLWNFHQQFHTFSILNWSIMWHFQIVIFYFSVLYLFRVEFCEGQQIMIKFHCLHIEIQVSKQNEKVSEYVCGGQKTVCGVWFSSFSIWILEIEINSLVLTKSIFIHWAISLTQIFEFCFLESELYIVSNILLFRFIYFASIIFHSAYAT